MRSAPLLPTAPRRSGFALLLGLCAALFGAPVALGQTCTTSWTNPAGGAWEQASNWSNDVPKPGGVACITLDGTYTVTTGTGSRAFSLLVIGGASGTQTLSSAGSFTVDHATVRPNGRWTLNYTAGGGLFATGAVSVEGVLQTSAASFLANSGTLDIAPGGTFRLAGGANVGGTSSPFRIRGTFEGVDCPAFNGCYVRSPIAVDGGILRVATTGQLQFEGDATLHNTFVEAPAGTALTLGGANYTITGTLLGTPEGTVYLSGITASAGTGGATLAVGGTGLQLVGSARLASAGGGFVNSGVLVQPRASGGNAGAFDGVEVRNTGRLLVATSFIGMLNGAIVRNEAGGTVEFLNGSSLGNGVYTTERFVNAGRVVNLGRESTSTSDQGGIRVPYDGLPGSVLRADAGTLRISAGGSLRDVAFEAAPGANVLVGGASTDVLRLSGTLSGTPEGVVGLYTANVAAEPAGVTLAVGGAGLHLSSAVQLVSTGGAFVNTGLVVYPSQPNNFVSLDGSIFLNRNRMVLDAGLGFRNGAALRNEAGGRIELGAAGSLGGVGGSNGRFDNAGRLVKVAAGAAVFNQVVVRTQPGGSYDALGGRIDLPSPAVRTFPAGSFLYGTNTFGSPTDFDPQGTISPGSDAQPVATLTWQGTFRPSLTSGSPQVVIDVDAGGASDRLAVQPGSGVEAVRLGGALIVRIRPGFTPAVGDTWTILTSTSTAPIAGRFGQVVAENAPSGLAFVAENAPDGRSVVLRAVAAAPGGPITLSSADLIGGGVRSLFLTGPGAPGVAAARLVCRECLDADSMGVLPARVEGAGTARVEARFDLTSPRAFGLYTLIIEQPGQPDLSVPVTVRPFVSYIHVLPVVNRGIGVRPSGLAYNWSLYHVWNVSNVVAPAYTFTSVGREDSTLVSFAVATGNPFGRARVFYESDAAARPGSDALLFARVVPRTPVALSIGQRIRPSDVRFPEQASTGPADPRIPFGALRLVTAFSTQHTTFERARFVVEGALRNTGHAALNAYLAEVDAADAAGVRQGVEEALRAESQYAGGTPELLARALEQMRVVRPAPSTLATDAATAFDVSLDRWSGWHYRDLDEAYRVDLATAPASVQALLQAEYDALLDPSTSGTAPGTSGASLFATVPGWSAQGPQDALGETCRNLAPASAPAKSVANNLIPVAKALGAAVCKMQPAVAARAPSGPPPGPPGPGGVAASFVPTLRSVGAFARGAAQQVATGGSVGSNAAFRVSDVDAEPSCGNGSGGAAGGSCGPPSAPADPNDKLADATTFCQLGTVVVDGVSQTRCVRHYVPLADATRPVHYTIAFENLPQATAPAEFVTITDTLDAGFDPASLDVVATSSDSTFSYSLSGNVVTFRFVGINLPPNRTAPEGQGQLVYAVTPRAGLPEGTVLRNRAHIVFDYNPAIATPEVLHELRAASDVAVVVDAPDSTRSGQPVPFNVAVANLQGDPAANVTLTLTANGQAFASAVPTAGSCSGTGTSTLTCAFGTLAPGTFERVAVTLAAPPAGVYTLSAQTTSSAFDAFLPNNTDQASLDVVTVGTEDEPTTGLPRAVTLGAASPNPAIGPVRLQYGLPHAADVRVSVYDLLGREVARLVDDVREAGWHTAQWDGALAAGIYVIRMTADDGEQRTQHARRVVVLR